MGRFNDCLKEQLLLMLRINFVAARSYG